MKFGLHLVDLWKRLTDNKSGMPPLPEFTPNAEDTFSSMEFETLWKEADMVDVCRWLRGGRNLKIPTAFRDLLPRKM